MLSATTIAWCGVLIWAFSVALGRRMFYSEDEMTKIECSLFFFFHSKESIIFFEGR